MADSSLVLLEISEKAQCRGMSHIFYAHYSERPSAKHRRELKAKSICRTCPVMEKCKQYARNNPEYGVWGGETEEERYLAGYAMPVGLRSSVRRTLKLRNLHEQSK